MRARGIEIRLAFLRLFTLRAGITLIDLAKFRGRRLESEPDGERLSLYCSRNEPSWNSSYFRFRSIFRPAFISLSLSRSEFISELQHRGCSLARDTQCGLLLFHFLPTAAYLIVLRILASSPERVKFAKRVGALPLFARAVL